MQVVAKHIPHPNRHVRAFAAELDLLKSPKPVELVVNHASGALFLGTYADSNRMSAALSAVRPHLTESDPWPAIFSLRASGVVAPDAYPPHIRAVFDDGQVGYVGKRKVGGDEVETSRAFRLPNTAHVRLASQAGSLQRKLDAEMKWERVRFPRSEGLPRYMRMTKGGAYQSRPWCTIMPGWESGINLGLYSPRHFDNDREATIAFARTAWKEFVKRMCGTGNRDVWEILKSLQRTLHMGMPLVRPHVLPPRVKRLTDGRFVGRAKRNGVIVWELGPYDTADVAWSAVKRWMRAKIARRALRHLSRPVSHAASRAVALV